MASVARHTDWNIQILYTHSHTTLITQCTYVPAYIVMQAHLTVKPHVYRHTCVCNVYKHPCTLCDIVVRNATAVFCLL